MRKSKLSVDAVISGTGSCREIADKVRYLLNQDIHDKMLDFCVFLCTM